MYWSGLVKYAWVLRLEKLVQDKLSIFHRMNFIQGNAIIDSVYSLIKS